MCSVLLLLHLKVSSSIFEAVPQHAHILSLGHGRIKVHKLPAAVGAHNGEAMLVYVLFPSA